MAKSGTSILLRARTGISRAARLLKAILPKRLYARSLLIVIAPVVLLDRKSVV